MVWEVDLTILLRALVIALLISLCPGLAHPVGAGPEEDDDCARLATTGLLQGSGIDIGPASTATLTGCRQDASGDWFYPVDSDDPRLPGGSILTEQEKQAVASVRARIQDQLAGFPPTLIGWMQENLADLRRKAVTSGRPSSPRGRRRPRRRRRVAGSIRTGAGRLHSGPEHGRRWMPTPRGGTTVGRRRRPWRSFRIRYRPRSEPYGAGCNSIARRGRGTWKTRSCWTSSSPMR